MTLDEIPTLSGGSSRSTTLLGYFQQNQRRDEVDDRCKEAQYFVDVNLHIRITSFLIP